MVDNLVRAERQLEQLRLAFGKKLPERVQELVAVAANLYSAADEEAIPIAQELGGLAPRQNGS